MSEDKTQHLPSFQEQVFAKLDEISSRLGAIESRVSHAEEVRSSLDQLVKDFGTHRTTVTSLLNGLSDKLSILNDDIFKVRADQRDVQARIQKLEADQRPQILLQDHQF